MDQLKKLFSPKSRGRILKFWRAHPVLPYALTFLLAFGLFSYLQATSGVADPDAFYHIKMAQMMAHQGLLTEFPALPYTTFSQNFTDHHLLYHFLLIPFVSLSPILGAKLA
ncbi:hypothetical protein HY224_01600, partial [Candidatus Uhrbacteria bacterium]|nr:hypothetical protein [Candidatus Uhrbacteria bacterium]